MTGFGDERLAVEIMKSGAVDYIVKSATVFEDLPNISRKALRFWENLQERMRAERAQQETQKRLADILAFLPDPVLAIDKNGVVIAWNNAMEELTGVPAADMLGRGDHEYSIPFYGERRPILVDIVLKDDPAVEGKYHYIKRDGQKIVSETFIPGMYGGKGAHLWGTATPIFDAGGNIAGAIEVIRDVSDRKQTEEDITFKNILLSTQQETSPDGILIVDDNSVILNCNRKFAEIWNIPDELIVSRKDEPLLEYVLGQIVDPETFLSRVRYLYDHKDENSYEELLLKDGRILERFSAPMLGENGKYFGRIWYFRDITGRKKDEQIIKASEQKFRTLIENVPDFIIVHRKGILLFVSRAASEVTGYSADELLGRQILDFVIPEDRERIVSAMQQRMMDEPVEPYEITILTKPGQTRQVIIRGSRIEYEGAPASLNVLTDVTEMRRGERALEESESRFRNLFNNMSSGVVIYEPVSGGQDFIIRDINHAAETIEKVQKDEVIGKSVLQVFPGVVEFGIFSVFQRVARTGVAEAFPVSLYRDNRISGWRDNYVYRIASGEVVAVYQDLTEKKQAEEAIRESDERFRIVSHATNDTIWDWDFSTGRLWWSDGITSVFGYKEGEIEFTIGTWENLVHPDDRERVVTSLRGMIDAGRENWSDEYRLRKADGSYADVLDRGFIIRDASKNAVRMVGSILDITERKATERVLSDEATRRRILVDQSRDGIVTLDQDGKVFESNQRFADMLGYTPDEMKELHVWDWEAVAAREQLEGMIRSVDEGGDHIETRHRRKDGSLLDVEISTNAAIFSGRKLIFCVVRDISDKKAARRALEEREIRFRALIQNSSDIIRILDRDGKITYESDSAERILGYPPGTLIGKDPVEYIHPDDRERVKTDLQDVLMMNNPGTPTEFRIRREDGTYLWVESLGSNLMDIPGVNGVVITTRPIQQRKEAESALRESEERLRLALEGADAGFWDWHIPSGNAVFSDRFYTMLEYLPGEFPATYEAWVELMHPDDRKRVIPDLERQIREGDSQLEIEYRTKAKEGTWIWLLGRGKVVEKDAGGIPVRVTGVNIDITNRRLMESEIRSLNTVLEQRVKDRTEALSKANEALEEENMQRLAAEEKMRVALEEKTVLLKEIHHRVKNNLQIIASLLNLQSRYIEDEATLAAIRESQNRVKAMALVHEKLYRSEEISRIDLAEYIGFLGTGLFQFYDARSRGIRFTADIHDIEVDINTAIPLGLIINELISNSLKYAFPAGKSGEVIISIVREGEKLIVTFRDTGIGIPAELDWQNTRSLGLRLVNTLVDQLNGTIELDRTSGTRFTMVLQQKT
jgi:PAS domain S-box-containing protein